jgi:hypothetical protein
VITCRISDEETEMPTPFYTMPNHRPHEVNSQRALLEQRATSAAPAHSLRRFATWLSALFADDGMSARLAAERHHDEGLVRRVESRRRP